jgi:asparagine synthase (glutamine-hydrolysing)
MCGLTGILDLSRQETHEQLEASIHKMTETVQHRGPDASGVWLDPAAGIALGHRRLAIQDLSPNGHQPMASTDGRFVLVYNGEVYNFRQLQVELEGFGCRFRGHSDTEVILAACSHWGVAEAVTRMIGMFAFALWDKRERQLTLVRDRLGIKPLYWGRQGQLILFGSQPKSVICHPRWQTRINNHAQNAFLQFAYVPEPLSIYQDLVKMPPGTMISINPQGKVQETQYWNLSTIACQQSAKGWSQNEEEATATLDNLLRDAVKQRMIADVPLGAFLSGGVDSSLVTALMQAQSSRPIQTFSIGFQDEKYNEAEQAKAVAAHLGTQHTELYVSSQDALDLIPKLSEYYDEPFADASQLPTCLLSAMTRRSVTVALSGDGGDELFAGYNRHIIAQRIETIFTYLPHPLRVVLSKTLRSLPPATWDRICSLFPVQRQLRQCGDKVEKFSRLLALDQVSEIYTVLMSAWYQGSLPSTAIAPILALIPEKKILAQLPDHTARFQLMDLLTNLPGDILTKVDRASMAYGLEVRVPLLDHRVVEFAWNLPPSYKIRAGSSKWLLRQVLYQYVPQSLIERPKTGFTIPLSQWLRGPLREWAETMLEEYHPEGPSLISQELVQKTWKEHLSGRRNHQQALWNVLMFQTWRQRWMSC